MAGVLALFGLFTTPLAAQDRYADSIDLALVLAVDTSTSVDHGEFRLQMIGIANAFRDSSVRYAIRAGAPLGLAVTLMQWSGAGDQVQAIPWTILRSDADIDAFAEQVSAVPRLVRGGRTALGEAVAASLDLLAQVPLPARRRVIDVSGDGGSNDGRLPREARELAKEAGVTVNGIAILNEEPRLDQYFASDLITGVGAFQVTATDYVDFARAIRMKLVREIMGTPIAWLGDMGEEPAR
ncbi:MAG: DUF1194 domain-containing protein [Pseudomonadota bacterium]|nr:DUF1194 domain-containing protein [Pseudomonadota bacterium]